MLVEGNPPRSERFMGSRLEAARVVARYLELSDDQKASFLQLREEQRERVQSIQRQLGANRQELQQLLTSEAPEPARVGELVLQNRDLEQQLGELQSDIAQVFRGLLTEEQLRKFDHVEAASRLQPVVRSFQALGLVASPQPRRLDRKSSFGGQ